MSRIKLMKHIFAIIGIILLVYAMIAARYNYQKFNRQNLSGELYVSEWCELLPNIVIIQKCTTLIGKMQKMMQKRVKEEYHEPQGEADPLIPFGSPRRQ